MSHSDGEPRTPHLYAAHYFAKRHASPLFNFEARFFITAIAGRVLEVGCGGGALGEMVRRAPIDEYVGTDVVAQPGCLPDVVCEATHLPFDDDCFDVVIAQHVVEHLPDPMKFFLEAKRVLGGSGVLRFTTPNAAYPRPRLFDDPTHVNVWSVPRWTAALYAGGFQPKVTSHFAYLGHPYLLYTSARLARRFPRGGNRGAVVFAQASVGPASGFHPWMLRA